MSLLFKFTYGPRAIVQIYEAVSELTDLHQVKDEKNIIEIKNSHKRFFLLTT